MRQRENTSTLEIRDVRQNGTLRLLYAFMQALVFDLSR